MDDANERLFRMQSGVNIWRKPEGYFLAKGERPVENEHPNRFIGAKVRADSSLVLKQANANG